MTCNDDRDDADHRSAGHSLYAIKPGADYAGLRLDKWLSDEIEELTRTRIKALIEGGALRKDGEIFTDPSWKLREGEEFELSVPPPADPAPKGENIPLDIAFEDDALIVVNKPAGMVVHPAAGNWKGTLVNALIHHCGDSLSGIGGVARPGVVHRLDKDTTGLIVAAKNDRSHQALVQAFAERRISRIYEAVAIGAPRPGIGTIDAAIMRASTQRKKMAVTEEPTSTKARRAITHYKTLETFGRERAKMKGDALASRLELRLETGRTHQIRVHLGSIGHPLIGDPVYGRGPGLAGLKPGDPAADHAIKVLKKFRRQALHARVLGFKHPISGEAMHFETPPPADFLTLLEALRGLS